MCCFIVYLWLIGNHVSCNSFFSHWESEFHDSCIIRHSDVTLSYQSPKWPILLILNSFHIFFFLWVTQLSVRCTVLMYNIKSCISTILLFGKESSLTFWFYCKNSNWEFHPNTTKRQCQRSQLTMSNTHFWLLLVWGKLYRGLQILFWLSFLSTL